MNKNKIWTFPWNPSSPVGPDPAEILAGPQVTGSRQTLAPSLDAPVSSPPRNVLLNQKGIYYSVSKEGVSVGLKFGDSKAQRCTDKSCSQEILLMLS